MQFATRIDGEYLIYAGSLELRAGAGFMAAVVVNRNRTVSVAEQEITGTSRCRVGTCGPPHTKP